MSLCCRIWTPLCALDYSAESKCPCAHLAAAESRHPSALDYITEPRHLHVHLTILLNLDTPAESRHLFAMLEPLYHAIHVTSPRGNSIGMYILVHKTTSSNWSSCQNITLLFERRWSCFNSSDCLFHFSHVLVSSSHYFLENWLKLLLLHFRQNKHVIIAKKSEKLSTSFI